MASPIEKQLNEAIETLRAVQKGTIDEGFFINCWTWNRVFKSHQDKKPIRVAVARKHSCQTGNDLRNAHQLSCQKELAIVEDDGKVYKLIGPVLVKQVWHQSTIFVYAHRNWSKPARTLTNAWNTFKKRCESFHLLICFSSSYELSFYFLFYVVLNVFSDRYDAAMKEIQDRENKARDKCISLQRTMQQQQQQGQVQG